MRFVNSAKKGGGWTSFIMEIMDIYGQEHGHRILRVTTNLRSWHSTRQVRFSIDGAAYLNLAT